MGARRAAVEALEKATELAHDVPIYFNALATVLLEEGRHEYALETMIRAVSLAPSDPGTLVNYGVVLERMGKIEAALAAYESALAADNRFATARQNRGAALMSLQRFGEAVENNELLVALQPESADAHFNLSHSLLGLGQSERALVASERATVLDSRHVKAHIDRGLALADLGRFDEAQRVFDAVDAIEPNAIRAYLDRIAPADPALTRRIDPRLFFLYRGYDRLMRCDWSVRNRYIKELVNFVGSGNDQDAVRMDLPLAYQALAVPVPPEVPPRIASVIGERYAAAVADTGIQFSYSQAGRRIRIGYLSADYCEHLNAYLSYPLFRMHDRSRFEIHAYSIGPDDGAVIRQNIKTSADRFVDLRNASDVEAARIINGNGIDVLVDFGGYTDHCRPGIAAFRPAPVQMAHIGFPGTMGAPWIDYRITDRIATPAAQEHFWREKLIFMPDSFFICDGAQELPDESVQRADYGLADDAFVFCSFNNYYKIEPEIFGIWMELLRQAPSSVLWLAGRDPVAAANLRKEAAPHGVPAERLIFAPFESRERYRARFRLADLFLDTPVFNAMTTACDALAAGLPVLTVRGSSFPSRVAASLLSAAGFTDGIVDSLEHYREQALAWSAHRGVLARLRKEKLGNPMASTFVRYGWPGASARNGVRGDVAALPAGPAT